MSNNDIDRQFNINNEEHKSMAQKIDELNEGVNDIKVTLAGLPEKLADKFDERYASKEYENSLKKLNMAVITAVVLALLGLVVKAGV